MYTSTLRPLSKRFDIVVQELPQEILIYDLQRNKAFALNELSALVWQLCDGTRTVLDIAENLTFRLNQLVSEDLVWFALEQLKKDELIENYPVVPFEGLTRREIMMRVGFSSMVGLPFVWSVAAPQTIHAQSGCIPPSSGGGLGCACTANSQCPGTSTTRCCSNVPSNPRTCVVANTLRSLGQTCGNNCDCVSGCCAGTPGACFAFKVLPAGNPCVAACQCLNTCSGGVCT